MQLPETFAATCCQVIRDRRQRLTLSQEEIARRSGLARSYICDVERGARHPSLRNVSTLARALEISTSELIALVELNLASRVDLEALRTNEERNGLHSEIIRYYNERMTDGLIIADQDGFIFFNNSAQELLGIEAVPALKAEECPEYYGTYKTDKVTKYQSSELPLIKALNGESVDNADIYLKNPALPNGRHIKCTSRPVKIDGNTIAAAVIFHEAV